MLLKFRDYKFSVFTIVILDNESDSPKIKKGIHDRIPFSIICDVYLSVFFQTPCTRNICLY